MLAANRHKFQCAAECSGPVSLLVLGGLFDCASQSIDLSVWRPSRQSNEMLQPKCRRPADQSVCGKAGY